MTDAWGYVRLSQESDDSLDEQKASIREYASRNGLDLQTTRNDGQRTSGFDLEREEYQLLREKIERGEIGAVITRDRARIARDFDERLWLITTLRGTGVEWHVTEHGDRLHLEDIQKAGFECIHAMWDHYKKMIEIERSRQVVRDRQERGCYQGMPPLGLTFADDGCHLERDGAWSDVERAFEMLFEEDGTTYGDVVTETGFSRNQVKTLSERGPEWYAETLAEYGTEAADD